MKDNLYIFRRYKKIEGNKAVKHPKLIVDETNSDYGYMGLTSSRKSGHHFNVELKDNPEFIKINGISMRKSSTSYLRREIEYDKKNKFGELLYNYQLSDRDKKRN